MTSDIHNHLFDYALLAGWLTLGLIGLTYFRSNTSNQLWLMLIMLSGYVIWGTYHHYRLGDLNSKIVLEYGLIAGLSLTVVWAVMTML